MPKNEKFPIIGEVVSPHTDDGFYEFGEALTNSTSSELKREELIQKINSLLESGEDQELVLSSDSFSLLSREELEVLEKQKGIISVKYSEENPLGTYALDAVSYNSPFLKKGFSSEKISDHAIFILKNYFRGRFSLATQPSKPMSKEQINSAGFENIRTTAQVLAMCTKNKDGQWEWGSSQVYPDGFHIQPPLTATEQYAQSCFEGLVAMVNENGEITVFRPEENAKRLKKSCAALAIPPLDETQILESIKCAVLANKNYLPEKGSNAKMYIRPYVKGLEGGYGVGPANSYLFAIEVFPFGDYAAKRGDVINIVGIPGKRRSHEGNFGMVKGSGNYGQTLLDREKAKKGMFPEYAGQKFQDTFYLGLAQEKQEIDGQEVTTVKEVLDEDSAGNLFFISEQDGKIHIYTPPLERGAILPGITRASVLEISKELGFEVEEKELEMSDIEKMDGAFLSGSAAGIVRVGTMTYLEKQITFDQSSEDQNNISKTFFKIYDLLYSARKGELKDNAFPDNMKQWAKVIGKV